MSLRDCVSDLLGHGIPIDSIETVEPRMAVMRSSETARAQCNLQNAQKLHSENNMLTLYITEWSNGFEPLLSNKRKQRLVLD